MNCKALLYCIFIAINSNAFGQSQSIKIGELNSYKVFPAFLEPYKKGWQLALEEINRSGGVLGRQLEVVSRDDGGTPGDAVRVAEELISREKADVLMGTFASNVGLAVANLANQRKILFLAAEPLTDKLVWENGNRYTFRLRPSTYMQVAMLVPEAARLNKKRWAIVVPNYEYGQSAAASFRKLLTRAQPGVEFVAEQAPPLGRIDAGAVVQALLEARPEAIFSALFAVDLQKFVREGNTRGLFKSAAVVNLLGGEPEYLDPISEAADPGAARRRVRRRAGAAARQDRRRRGRAGAARGEAGGDLQRLVCSGSAEIRARRQYARPVQERRSGQPARRGARVPRPDLGSC